MYIPAVPPESAISDSSVDLVGVSHLTKANEVNENTKHKADAQAIAGPMKGSQRFLTRPRREFPAGSNLICSSHLGSIVDNVGSTIRTTSEILNQA